MADENMNTIHITEKQKVQEITDKLEEGLKELFESEKYKTYLSTMSKFHNYSFNKWAGSCRKRRCIFGWNCTGKIGG